MPSENARFWRDAARSLPAHVRARYASYFDTAERWELALDRALDLGARIRLALARRSHTQAA